MDEPARDRWEWAWRFLQRHGMSGVFALVLLYNITIGNSGDLKATRDNSAATLKVVEASSVDLKAIRESSAETLRVVKQTQTEAQASQARAERAEALSQKLLIKICQNTARTDAAREACD